MSKEVYFCRTKSHQSQMIKTIKSYCQSSKRKVKSSQLKAAIKVNYELWDLYWALGEYIVKTQEKHSWGDSFIKLLAEDLQKEFPNMKGFSQTNVK